MADAVDDLLLLDRLEGLVHQAMVIILEEARQLLRPQRLEVPLEDAEVQLDGVVLASVRHIVDELEAQRLHVCLRLFSSVAGQVVQEQADLIILILLAELRQILLKLLDVDRLGEDHIMLLTFFLRYAAKNSQCRLVQLGHVHGHIVFGQAILLRWHRPPGNHRLVNEYDSVLFLLGLG
ncbi:MAG: hypothetical protein VXU46_04755 [Planctomycetota bacterium]|nr:hypothetical protein [Planctomycetota bacterium]